MVRFLKNFVNHLQFARLFLGCRHLANFQGTEVGGVAAVQVEVVVLEEVIMEEVMAMLGGAVVGICQVVITKACLLISRCQGRELSSIGPPGQLI